MNSLKKQLGEQSHLQCPEKENLCADLTEEVEDLQ
jgi:hypothetical protein